MKWIANAGGHMETSSRPARCSACGEPLPLDYAGSCPGCGDTRKTHDVQLQSPLRIHPSLGWKHIHEYYERHKILFPLLLAITITAPFLGLVLAGWLGIVAGLLISLATLYLGLRAITKVREIREGHEP